MLVGFVPSIPGSEDFDEKQTVDAIMQTDYDQPVARRRTTPVPPAEPLPRQGGVFRASSAASETLIGAAGTPGCPPPGGLVRSPSRTAPASTAARRSAPSTRAGAGSSRTTLRKTSPSRPAMPTAAAAIARFCGETILPEHAAGAVRGRHQDRVEPGLVRRGDLQRAEQRVRRGVRAGHRDAEPAEIGERAANSAAGAGHPVAQRRGLPGGVHHVRERQHRHHRDDRGPAAACTCRGRPGRPGRARAAAPGW